MFWGGSGRGRGWGGLGIGGGGGEGEGRYLHISPRIRNFCVCGIVPSWRGFVDSTFVKCTFGFGFFSTATVEVVRK